jgi:protein-S-isoprenylcysteine O-methyltransferase Ste14
MLKHESRNGDSPLAAANLGAARPPVIYFSAILAGGVLQRIHPLPFVSRSAVPFGVGIALLAVIVFVCSVQALRMAGTPVPGNQPTTTLVIAGPYRFSRNPIYLAFSMLQAGIALALSSAWILVMLLPAMTLISWIVIPREERYLSARFGERYARYRSDVRRWL